MFFQLVVAKCWDPNPKDYFSVPRTEPVRPIDPGAWVAHTAAVRGLEIPQYPGAGPGPVAGQVYTGPGQGGGLMGAVRAPSVSTLTSSSPSLASTVQERPAVGQLTIQSGMKAICSAMQRTDSGLEVRGGSAVSAAGVGGAPLRALYRGARVEQESDCPTDCSPSPHSSLLDAPLPPSLLNLPEPGSGAPGGRQHKCSSVRIQQNAVR